MRLSIFPKQEFSSFIMDYILDFISYTATNSSGLKM